MVPKTDRDLTVMPRTTPNVRTVRYPSRKFAVVVMNSAFGRAMRHSSWLEARPVRWARSARVRTAASGVEYEQPLAGVVGDQVDGGARRQGSKEIALDEVVHVRVVVAATGAGHRPDVCVARTFPDDDAKLVA